tara:strand:- start:3498 stop:3884 length:387 start_codon:yes stop_codon:yes gene_type:complete
VELDLRIDRDGKTARLTLDGAYHVNDIAAMYERLASLGGPPDLTVMAHVGDARVKGASLDGLREVDAAFSRFSSAYPAGTQVIMVRDGEAGGVASMLANLAQARGYALRIYHERDGVLTERPGLEGEG